MNEILMCGTDPVGQLYKDTKAEATSIAPIEVSPAESAHSVGTHIMVDGVRYKVTSAISVGDTLTIGTNISAENIEDNLDATHIPYDSNISVKEKIDSLEWKYAGTLDMASPPSGAFDWTATESGTDFANAKEIMLMITLRGNAGIEYPRTTTISIVNGANSTFGVDVNYFAADTRRIYALGIIKNTTQLTFNMISNGGLEPKIKIYWK